MNKLHKKKRQVVKLAEQIFRQNPNATLSVFIEIDKVSKNSIKSLSVKGAKIKYIRNKSNVVTAVLPTNPSVVKSIAELPDVKRITISREVEVL